MDVCLCGWNMSTPDTLQHSFYYDSRVDISVCVCLFWNATLNLFGQSETVWDKGFCFGSQTTQQFISLVSIFYFCSLVSTHLFASGIQTTIWSYSIRTLFFFFFFLISLSTALCLTLPPPSCLKRSSGFIWKKRSAQNLFMPFWCYQHCLGGKVAHSIFCFLLNTQMFI